MDYRARLHPTTPDEYRKLMRFNMERPPIRQRNILRPLTWLLSLPPVWRKGLRIYRTGMEGIKPPFILLCTHMAFIDFKVTTTALFPWRSSYIVAIDGFIGREALLRHAGGVLKRRVTADINLIRHIKTILHGYGDVVTIYPEARYSLIGRPACIPGSLAKMLRSFKVPVAMLRMHGNYLGSPVWNLKERGNRIEAEMFRLFSPEELETLPLDQIRRRIDEAFTYDEYRWQRENRVKISVPFRAEGLHRVIYHCPACKTDHQMSSRGEILKCDACGKQWRMDEYGVMQALAGQTEFSHLPDWYDEQVRLVREELDRGEYRFEDQVRVESLVNHKGYYDVGTARVVHSAEGFLLEGDPGYFSGPIIKKPRSMYSCHIEYDYFGKGDCFELSTLDETFYLYPLNQFNRVTKILIATEELYRRQTDG